MRNDMGAWIRRLPAVFAETLRSNETRCVNLDMSTFGTPRPMSNERQQPKIQQIQHVLETSSLAGKCAVSFQPATHKQDGWAPFCKSCGPC